MNDTEIRSVLKILGERVPPASQLILVGGGALALLGSPRQTIDIDFIGDDVNPNALHRIILNVARDLNILMEPVLLDQFIPLPVGSDQRALHIGRFGNLNVYVADPYSIALSKLDRGLDTDIDDIVFLVNNGFVETQKLESVMISVLPKANQYDLNPDMLEHFKELQRRLNN